MKKYLFIIAAFAVAALCSLFCGCKKSDAPVVGTYYLVTVTADNGVNRNTYTADGSDSLITGNSFVLEIKDNYRWNMNIVLPGIIEHEDGKWEDKNGVYRLIEDKDEPAIVLSYEDGTLKFTMAEDGYILSVTLAKQS